jgi:hypothetical protein
LSTTPFISSLTKNAKQKRVARRRERGKERRIEVRVAIKAVAATVTRTATALLKARAIKQAKGL